MIVRVREGEGGWAEALSLKVRGDCVLRENLGLGFVISYM